MTDKVQEFFEIQGVTQFGHLVKSHLLSVFDARSFRKVAENDSQSNSTVSFFRICHLKGLLKWIYLTLKGQHFSGPAFGQILGQIWLRDGGSVDEFVNRRFHLGSICKTTFVYSIHCLRYMRNGLIFSLRLCFIGSICKVFVPKRFKLFALTLSLICATDRYLMLLYPTAEIVVCIYAFATCSITAPFLLVRFLLFDWFEGICKLFTQIFDLFV